MIHIGEPAHTFHSNEFPAIFVKPPTGSIQRIFIGYLEFPVAAVDGISHPHLVTLNQRESLFISHSIHVADDDELFAG